MGSVTVGDGGNKNQVLWAPGIHTYLFIREFVLHGGGLYYYAWPSLQDGYSDVG